MQHIVPSRVTCRIACAFIELPGCGNEPLDLWCSESAESSSLIVPSESVPATALDLCDAILHRGRLQTVAE